MGVLLEQLAPLLDWDSEVGVYSYVRGYSQGLRFAVSCLFLSLAFSCVFLLVIVVLVFLFISFRVSSFIDHDGRFLTCADLKDL